MSEGVKRRAKKTAANQESREKEAKVGFDEKERQRSLSSSLVFGIISLIWSLFKTALGTILLLYVVLVIIMYTSPAARELVIYLHPCKCVIRLFKVTFRSILIQLKM